MNDAAASIAQVLSHDVDIGNQADDIALYFKTAQDLGFNTVRIFDTVISKTSAPGLPHKALHCLKFATFSGCYTFVDQLAPHHAFIAASLPFRRLSNTTLIDYAETDDLF